MTRNPSQVADVKLWRKNPRKISEHDLETLKHSMKEFGDLGGIVFNLTTGHVVGGHQRLKNLDPKWKITRRSERNKTGTVSRGYILTPDGKFTYREVQWPLLKEKAANLAANKIQGDWDYEKLAPILEELAPLPEFNLTGFTAQEANIIIEQFPDATTEEETVIPLPAKAQTKPGQIWQLGDHRLLCADATDPANWDCLMDGAKGHLAITDPPYGVNMRWSTSKGNRKNPYTGKRKFDRVWGDAMAGDETSDTALATLPLLFANLIPNAAVYITAGTNLMLDIYAWLREQGIHYGVGMVWDKGPPAVVSWNRYHPIHESIIFCGKGALPGGNNKRWFGEKNEVTVWDIRIDDRGTKMHRAQKPVALYERAMINSSAPGEIVVDPFAGSGSCIIAAEKHQRKAYLMEMEPAYCDLIVARWMTLTGQKVPGRVPHEVRDDTTSPHLKWLT